MIHYFPRFECDPSQRFSRCYSEVYILFRVHRLFCWLVNVQSCCHSTCLVKGEIYALYDSPSIILQGALRTTMKVTAGSTRILTSPPEKRTADDINRVMVDLQFNPSFCALPLSVQRGLARLGTYHLVSRQRVIIKWGHVGQRYYFILSGQGRRQWPTESSSLSKVRVKQRIFSG